MLRYNHWCHKSYFCICLDFAATGMNIGGLMAFRSRNLLRFRHQNMLSTWWTGLNLNWMMNPSSHRRLVNLFDISCPPSVLVKTWYSSEERFWLILPSHCFISWWKKLSGLYRPYWNLNRYFCGPFFYLQGHHFLRTLGMLSKQSSSDCSGYMLISITRTSRR